MLDKSGEFFLKPCVSIMYIVFDFKRVQLVGSWSVPGGFWSVPDGFWSVLLGSGQFFSLVYAAQNLTNWFDMQNVS